MEVVGLAAGTAAVGLMAYYLYKRRTRHVYHHKSKNKHKDRHKERHKDRHKTKDKNTSRTDLTTQMHLQSASSGGRSLTNNCSKRSKRRRRSKR